MKPYQAYLAASIITPCLLLAIASCNDTKTSDRMALCGSATLDSVYAHYGVEGSFLLRENYPSDDSYRATYLASEEQQSQPNAYSYLWPFSGTFSAANALFEATADPHYRKLIDERVLPGLEEYFDTLRQPAAYSSYISSAPQSDRFYDDNIWLGIDFTDLYRLTREKRYLDKAQLIWQFIRSGTDDTLGGGIYWCEQKKGSKNTCSNAPGSVLALKLFRETADSTYLREGIALYEWTQRNLQDSTDALYFDNISLKGKIGRAKFAYNSGQMMQAAVLLYKLTDKQDYLDDAQELAAACYGHFFSDFTAPDGESFRMLRKGNIWFTAVMLRGFVELYAADQNPVYLNAFRKNLDYAWEHARDSHGLFETDWSGVEKREKKWLLTEAAMAEMFARIASAHLPESEPAQ